MSSIVFYHALKLNKETMQYIITLGCRKKTHTVIEFVLYLSMSHCLHFKLYWEYWDSLDQSKVYYGQAV